MDDQIHGRYQEKNCVLINEEDYKEFTCRYCNNAPFKIQFKSDHVQRISEEDYDGETTLQWFVVYCPYCGKRSMYAD